MIALIGALWEELSGISKDLTVVRQTARGTWRLSEGRFTNKELLLMQTGIGKERAQAATEYLQQRYPISVVVSLGFGGALASGVEAGDLVLCRNLLCDALTEKDCVRSSDRGLITLAAQTMQGKKITVHMGDCLTAEHLVKQPGEKERLGSKFRAMVVDMESYWIASLITNSGIPFLAVRAVSDSLGERLPPFDQWQETDGEGIGWIVLRHFLQNPRDLYHIPQIAYHAWLAHKSLTKFLYALIPQLS